MKNWEHFFGTPERAAQMEVEFQSWPFIIIVKRTSRMSACTSSHQLVEWFYEEAEYLKWLKAEHDDGTIRWEDE